MRTLGRRGGRARADRLSPERRREIATLGSHAAAEKRRERAVGRIVIVVAGAALAADHQYSVDQPTALAGGHAWASEGSTPWSLPDHVPEVSHEFLNVVGTSAAVTGTAVLSTEVNGGYLELVRSYWDSVSTGTPLPLDVVWRLIPHITPKTIQGERQHIAGKARPPGME